MSLYPSSSPSGSITVGRGRTAVVIDVRGEIDVALHAQVEGTLAEVAAAGLPVVIDLSACRMLGAPGVALVVGCERLSARAGVPCVVRDAPPAVARVLAALDAAAGVQHDQSRTSVSS